MLSEKVEREKPYILGHDNEPDEEDLAIETKGMLMRKFIEVIKT